MRSYPQLSSGLFALICTACSAGVFNYHGDAPARRAPSQQPAHVAINPLAFPHTTVAVVRGAALQEQSGSTRIAELEEHLRRLLSDSGLAASVVPSSDLPRGGLSSPGFVVEYSVRSYHTTQSIDPGGMAGAIVAAILTGGLGSMLVCAPTNRIHHEFAVEMRVVRAETAALISHPDPVTGRLVAQYDTAGAEAVLSRRYDLEITSGHPACGPPSGPGLVELNRREGRQAARLIYQASVRELYEAIGRALRAGEPARAVGATSGGEEVAEFRAVIREQLQRRSEAILLCTGRSMVAVTASWSPGAEVQLALRDVSDAEVVECARAALGPLRAPSGASGTLLHIIQD